MCIRDSAEPVSVCYTPRLSFETVIKSNCSNVIYLLERCSIVIVSALVRASFLRQNRMHKSFIQTLKYKPPIWVILNLSQYSEVGVVWSKWITVTSLDGRVHCSRYAALPTAANLINHIKYFLTYYKMSQKQIIQTMYVGLPPKYIEVKYFTKYT